MRDKRFEYYDSFKSKKSAAFRERVFQERTPTLTLTLTLPLALTGPDDDPFWYVLW